MHNECYTAVMRIARGRQHETCSGAGAGYRTYVSVVKECSDDRAPAKAVAPTSPTTLSARLQGGGVQNMIT